MPKLTIDGNEIEVPPGTTILQACEHAGIEVAHFCYHERLAIAGNCRMCLVEVEKSPKPIASCAMPATDGMVVLTESEKAIKARKGVMEFLLINHPLDCPICDQGGECDLQDQAMAYGFDRGRFEENKRAVHDKDFGPLVETHMTRCIHCTRCIRFMTEIAGVEELGATGRGEDMEITTYIERALDSELSANIIDLCPVGALTSKPYAFVARPWELTKTESIDVLDAVGSNIRIDARGPQVLRVLPRVHEAVNEEWISDKTRYAIDGLVRRRLDRPFIGRDGKRAVAWREAIEFSAERLKTVPGERIAAIAGDLCDTEAMFALKELLTGLGATSLDCRQDGAKLDPSCRAGYLFNTTIAGIENADACLLVGANPRWEAPLVNARMRKRHLQGGFRIAAIGAALDLTFPVEMLGNDGDLLNALVAGEHPWAAALRNAKSPMIVVGQGALARSDGARVVGAARQIADSCGLVRDDWNGFNILHSAAARVGGLDIGFVPGAGGRNVDAIVAGCRSGDIEVLYLLGADEIDCSDLGSAFVIYQGHHGDAGARRSDVVLPGCAYTEKDGTYVNTEGRVQLARRAVFPPGEAREDWKIVRALSDAIGRPLPFDTLRELRRRMWNAHPLLAEADVVRRAAWAAFGEAGPVSPGPFEYPIKDFYHTDPISRASETMAQCSELFVARGGTAPRRGLVPMASFWTGYALPTVITAVEVIVVVVPLLLAIAMLTYAERKVLAYSQLRKGPNVVGPFGLLQPFADGLKLLVKETIVPSGANRIVFVIAPLVTFTLALVAWAVIPFAPGVVVANINVGVLYLYAISSLGVYGIILAGWASNSRYAFLGALRSAAQMVSYEVAIGFVLVTVLLCAGSLNLTEIVEAQRHIWFAVPLLPMFVIFFISALAETGRAPFDLPEGESEIVAGYFVEYSSMAFALFYLGEYGNMILMSAMTSVLFLGGWLAPFGVPPFTWVPGWLWFLFKIAFVLFCFLWVRTTFPRYRYDQLMRLGWKVFLPFSLLWLVLTAGVLTAAGWLPAR